MKNGLMMIPFKYYFGNDTCLLDLIINWIQQYISPFNKVYHLLMHYLVHSAQINSNQLSLRTTKVVFLQP
jgi:hypothetical protein